MNKSIPKVERTPTFKEDVSLWTYHIAAGVAGVLQVVVQQLGGSVLEGFGQSTQQHGELRRVELEQSDQDHLGRLKGSR